MSDDKTHTTVISFVESLKAGDDSGNLPDILSQKISAVEYGEKQAGKKTRKSENAANRVSDDEKVIIDQLAKTYLQIGSKTRAIRECLDPMNGMTARAVAKLTAKYFNKQYMNDTIEKYQKINEASYRFTIAEKKQVLGQILKRSLEQEIIYDKDGEPVLMSAYDARSALEVIKTLNAMDGHNRKAPVEGEEEGLGKTNTSDIADEMSLIRERAAARLKMIDDDKLDKMVSDNKE